ncbi:MAG: AAA family ATPase [Patulibacter sp.]|nr:AAA family ATPase [Patulibacter sp.]
MPALLERDRELRELRGHLAAAVDGEGVAVTITGPAGIGKSRLLEAFVAEARADALVLTARAGPMEQDFSFGVVRQLLERLVTHAEPAARSRMLDGAAALALPAIGGAPTTEPSDADAAFSIRHGLFWLIANLALEHPLVLAVDDLHWVDPPSLRALVHIAVRLDGLPVLLIAGRRTGEAGVAPELLDELERVGAAVVRPAPLTEDGVRTVVRQRLGDPSAALVQAVRFATGGIPFLLDELLRTLQAAGLDATAVQPQAINELGSEGVARFLLDRLRRLPPETVDVARAIAVLNGHAELRYVAAVAGLDADATGDAVDALVDAEILKPGRPCSFLHPTMRAAIYEDTALSALASRHRRAADAMRSAGRPDAELAPHLLATEPSGDPQTVDELREAAARAIGQGAPDLAQRYLRRALIEPPQDSLDAVLAELGDAEWLAGEDLEAAVAHLAEALERCDDLQRRPERALALHRALFAAGRLGEAVAMLERELVRFGDVVDREVALRVQAELTSIALLHPSTVDRVDQHLERHGQLRGETPSELLQLANMACWKWARGSAEETVELGRRSLTSARAQAADPSDSIPIYEALWALSFTDEIAFTRDLLRATMADARARGSIFGVTTSASLLTLLALRVGDTAEAEAEARSAAGLPGLSDFVRPPLFGYLAQALIWRGDLDAAQRAIDASGCGPDLPEFVCLNPVFFTRGILRLALGDVEAALSDFLELRDRSERLGLRNPCDGWRSGATDALILLDRRDDAVSLATEQLELARAWGTDFAVGTALHGLARARAAGHGGQTPAAGGAGPRPAEHVAELAAAERLLARAPGRLEHARCLVELGTALRHAGRRSDAREPLRRGLDMARRCGAAPLAQRAHGELLVAGARPRRLMFSGVEALTPSERRVADMAAAGQTNRAIAQALFVTPKTVENQLGRVYGKLGVSSRTALPDALRPPPARGLEVDQLD